MLFNKVLKITIIVQILFLAVTVSGSDEEDNNNVITSGSSTANATDVDNDDFGEFLDFVDEGAPSSHFQEKEDMVKQQLVRAWKNPNMQRKFAEVLPILKVMSSQQKIALAALVSAQVGAKQGRELNLNQVRFFCGSVFS